MHTRTHSPSAGDSACSPSPSARRPHALQTDSILPKEGIDWPSAEELGAAIRRFKARGKTQHDSSLSKRPADPAGYLTDAEVALGYGLIDHAFPYDDAPLTGDRLQTMIRWLEMHADTFPKASVRARVAKLKDRLAIRDAWKRRDYEVAVRVRRCADITNGVHVLRPIVTIFPGRP